MCDGVINVCRSCLSTSLVDKYLRRHPYGFFISGFAKNSSYFPLFLSKLLQESKDLMAPSSCFKTVPVGPERNMFEVGMKLEAIDTKNPYLIAPATIGESWLVRDRRMSDCGRFWMAA